MNKYYFGVMVENMRYTVFVSDYEDDNLLSVSNNGHNDLIFEIDEIDDNNTLKIIRVLKANENYDDITMKELFEELDKAT